MSLDAENDRLVPADLLATLKSIPRKRGAGRKEEMVRLLGVVGTPSYWLSASAELNSSGLVSLAFFPERARDGKNNNMEYDRKTWLEDLGQDFQQFLEQGEYANARVCEDRLVEAGMIDEALTFTRMRCAKQMLENSKI